MTGKLSANAQQELDAIAMARRKLDRIHGLVEQFAVASKGQDQLAISIGRAALELGRLLLGQGFGVIADQANQLGMLARRGGTTQTKIRGMRDYVASLRPALERAERSVYDKEKQAAGEGST
jgi:hypothetical protein